MALWSPPGSWPCQEEPWQPSLLLRRWVLGNWPCCGFSTCLRAGVPGRKCHLWLNAHIPLWWVLHMWLRPPPLNTSLFPTSGLHRKWSVPPLPVLGAPPPAWAACPSHSLHGPSLSPFQSQCMTDLSVPTQCGSECHPTSRWWSRVTPWRTGSQLALGTTLVTMGGVGCIRARWSQQGLGEGVWHRRLFREPAGLAAHA